MLNIDWARSAVANKKSAVASLEAATAPLNFLFAVHADCWRGRQSKLLDLCFFKQNVLARLWIVLAHFKLLG